MVAAPAGRRDGTAAAGAPAGLGARAARFAALGEPVRLTIVEHLALGDAAPSELGALVDLPSNLLAHHLKVLEDADVVRRVRSEGDRRRSYVQLRLADPAVAALVSPPLACADGRLVAAGGATRVLFVCTHNSARSQLAAAAWQHVSDLPAASAGTQPAPRVHPRAVAAARRHGLHLAGQLTRRLDETAQPGDLLVAVCDNAYEDLGPAPTTTGARGSTGRRPPGADDAVPDRGGVQLHWSIPDPVRTDTDDAFEAAYHDLNLRVQHLADTLGRRVGT